MAQEPQPIREKGVENEDSSDERIKRQIDERLDRIEKMVDELHASRSV